MKNTLILCGGVSAEHEVSIISARNVLQALDSTCFHPLLVIVSQTGTWYLQKDPSIIQDIHACTDPFPHGEICTLIRIYNDTFLMTRAGELIKADVAFPLIHGPMGEDGTLQGMLELKKIPYVGSGVLSSTINMDKHFFKKILAHVGIPIVPFICLSRNQPLTDFSTASATLETDTFFIKPCTLGSSVGIFKVTDCESYNLAVEQAFKYSSKILVEKFIPAREIECAVLGNHNPRVSCLAEIKPHPKHEFYSYEAKYLDPQGAELIVNPSLDEAIINTIRELAVKAYKTVECKGLARVDFFIGPDDAIYVNEINTIPGFTSISMYPKLWEASGIPYSALVTNLIDLAFETHQEKSTISLKPF